jgi:hypothetical protein
VPASERMPVCFSLKVVPSHGLVPGAPSPRAFCCHPFTQRFLIDEYDMLRRQISTGPPCFVFFVLATFGNLRVGPHGVLRCCS